MKKLLLAAMLFAVVQLHAQLINEKDTPFIEVTGTAEKEVVPDIIYISITLYDKDVDKKIYSISAQEEKLKQGLQSSGIDLKNLSLSGASTDIVKYKRKNRSVVDERKQYLLKVSTAAEVNKVFTMLHTINVDEAVVSGTDHSQITELRKEVRINAIKAAKEKAIYLLEAIGEQPGKPLVITEENDSSYRPNQIYMSNTVKRYEADVPTEDTDFEKINIKFSYYVKYSIK